MFLKDKVYGRRSPDKADHKSSPWDYGSGELKCKSKIANIFFINFNFCFGLSNNEMVLLNPSH